jgi:hypothetical protein
MLAHGCDRYACLGHTIPAESRWDPLQRDGEMKLRELKSLVLMESSQVKSLVPSLPFPLLSAISPAWQKRSEAKGKKIRASLSYKLIVQRSFIVIFTYMHICTLSNSPCLYYSFLSSLSLGGFHYAIFIHSFIHTYRQRQTDRQGE